MDPTTVKLESIPFQPGLGPAHMEDLDLTKENLTHQVVGSYVFFLAPTIVDLETRNRNLGLGPANMAQLQLQKEDIGLKDEVVCLDYLSPQTSPMRYGGANFRADEIQQCQAKGGLEKIFFGPMNVK